MENAANRAELCGSFLTLPEFSHENHGHKFYQFYLSVDRLSGTPDTLKVLVPEKVLLSAELNGSMLYVQGQVRSYHEYAPDRRHLRIFVFADWLQSRDAEPLNDITLTGTLQRPPTLRRTPLGREICDLLLAVPRSYDRTDILPCIAWGRTAREISLLPPGQQLALCGRLQSREYRKEGERHTAYEISILSAQPLEDLGELSRFSEPLEAFPV